MAENNSENSKPENNQSKNIGEHSAQQKTNQQHYWRDNIRLLLILMAIWFVISFGFGILLREFLDQFHVGGYPLGFWFAQQGSIYGFIILIIIYVRRMKKLERIYDLDD